jgi:hypothetical protein
MSDQRYLIFVNYRGSVQNWATELVYARMTEAFGADSVFKAGNSIRAGEEFPPILRMRAASCPVMLACIGPGWLAAGPPGGGRSLDSPDDWVRREIAISLQAENHVLPLLIGNHDEVAIPPAGQLPEDIRAMVYHQAWRLAPGGGLDATVPRLVDRLVELVPELAERRGKAGSGPGLPRPSSGKAAASPDSGRDTYVQENVAHGRGTVTAVQNGNLYVNRADTPVHSEPHRKPDSEPRSKPDGEPHSEPDSEPPVLEPGSATRHGANRPDFGGGE